MVKSCTRIEHGIGFFPDYIGFCCLSGHEGGGQIRLVDKYNGEKINWDNLQKRINAYRDYARKGSYPKGCKGCSYIIDGEWDDENYVNELVIAHWTYCNSNCIYCYTEEYKEHFNKLKAYELYPIIKEMVDRKILSKDAAINFGGGEPTILTEMEKLLNLFYEYDIKTIRIPSNGMRYLPALKKGLKENRVSMIISVDAGTQKTFEKVKGKKCFNDVWKNIKKYASYNKDAISAKYIIIPGINDNKEEIDAFLKKAKEIKLERIIIDIESTWYNAHRGNVPEKIQELFDYFYSNFQNYGITTCELYERAQYLRREVGQEITH